MKYEENSLYQFDSKLGEKEYSLFDLAEWINGRAFKSTDFSSQGIPIIKISELNNGINNTTQFTLLDFPEKFLLKPGDLLFSWSGNPDTSIKVFKFTLKEGWLNQHIYKTIPNSILIDPDYFYYLLQVLEPRFKMIAQNKQTTGLGHITIQDLKRMKVKIPNIKYQNKISQFLEKLDLKIELNKKINKNLQELALTCFENLLNGSGEEKIEFSQIAEINPYRKAEKGKNYRFISMSNLSTQSLFPNNWKYEELKGGTRFINGDTLLARITPCLENGKAAFINFLDEDEIALGSTEYIVFHPKNPDYPPEFFACLIKNRDFISYAQKAMTGTSGRQRINNSALMQYLIPSPNKSSLKIFSKIAPTLFNKIKANEYEIRRLNSLKASLLPKLLSGEIEL